MVLDNIIVLRSKICNEKVGKTVYQYSFGPKDRKGKRLHVCEKINKKENFQFLKTSSKLKIKK